MGWTGVYADPPERDIDPENPYADPAALMQHRQQKVREKLIRVEKAKVRLSSICSHACLLLAQAATQSSCPSQAGLWGANWTVFS